MNHNLIVYFPLCFTGPVNRYFRILIVGDCAGERPYSGIGILGILSIVDNVNFLNRTLLAGEEKSRCKE